MSTRNPYPLGNNQGQLPGNRSDSSDISIVEILIALRQHWKSILVTTSCFLLFGIGIAFILPAEYRAEVILLPPLEKDVALLNIPGHYKINSKELFEKLIGNLQSNSLKRDYVLQHIAPRTSATDELASQETFADEFTVKITKSSPSRQITEDEIRLFLHSYGKDPEQIALWLNGFVDYANRATIDQIIAAIAVQQANLEKKIDSIRSAAEQKRQNRIARLEDSLVIAQKVGLEEQATIPIYTLSQTVSASLSDEETHEEKLQTDHYSPDYLKGSRALSAEITVLKERKNNDPFITELPELLEKAKLLQRVAADNKNTNATLIDKGAVAEDKPAKPNKILIAALCLLAGLMFSTFSAIIKNLLHSQLPPK